MSRFLKDTARCLVWLLLAEIMCLVLAFSFAILPQAAMQYLSLFCCLLAYVLLMGNCGMNIAKDHVVLYRQQREEIPLWRPVCMSLLTAVPLLILYGVLWVIPEHIAYMNIYLLLNAPVLQILNLILDGAETFSSLSAMQRLWMGLLPFVSSAAVFVGYMLHYPKHLAEEKVQRETKAA